MYPGGRAVPGGSRVIVRDILNTRPPEVLAAWLNGLGSFDELTPRDAAGRWGCSITEAMERLHAMVGGPLAIPAGQVERYRRIPWSLTPALESSRLPGSRDERRAERLAMIPAGGARRCDLARIWGLSEKNIDATLKAMVNQKLIKREEKIWKRI
jgi:hypothetical protein